MVMKTDNANIELE